MTIDHVALWTRNLEGLKDFYIQFFGGKPNEKYHNPSKGFESYFLSFDSGTRLELMQMPTIPLSTNNTEAQFTGFIHLAFSVGSPAKVDALTEQLRAAGHMVVGEPRTTGDGCYESVILDPDGNRLEITE
jgi:lactoylglutathione lyase